MLSVDAPLALAQGMPGDWPNDSINLYTSMFLPALYIDSKEYQGVL